MPPSNGALFVNGPIFSNLNINAIGGLAVGTSTPQSGGNVYVSGNITAGGTVTGSSNTATTNAANVSAGSFGSNTGGGNFSFPASLSVNTSTAPSGGVAYFNGNVGIGTASPTNKLDVAGTGDFTTSLSVGTSTAAGGAAFFNGAVFFNGNVSIGTSTPLDRLIVSQSVSGNPVRIDMDNTNNNTSTGIGSHLAFLNNRQYKWEIGNDLNNTGAQNFFIYDNVANTSRLFIDPGGNVGIGTTNPSYNLQVNGSFAATSKNFDIQDPRFNDPNRRLVHGDLEGPEYAVYYRGQAELENGKAAVTLPDYFEALTRKDGRTVLLTPLFESDNEPVSGLAASTVTNGRFTVRAIDANNPNQKFYWEVQAVRADVPPLIPEQIKSK